MKTLKEVYKNSSDEVRDILKQKFSNGDLGIESIEEEIKSEFLELLKKYSKNVKFLNEYGILSDLPTSRFELYDENGDWVFDIDYNEKNKHFWYSYYRIFPIFKEKYGTNEKKLNELVRPILEEHLNLRDVTPIIFSSLPVSDWKNI